MLKKRRNIGMMRYKAQGRGSTAMRYAMGEPVTTRIVTDYDVVVVGAGLAGLYTALNLSGNLRCCILTKEHFDSSNSWLAQGGIAAAISADDTPHLHLEDTLTAGAGLCDEAAVSVLVDEGPSDIQRLVSMNVPFDLGEDGDLMITREGGHSKRRIVHAGGDATGRMTVAAMLPIAAGNSHITLLENTFLVDILTDESGVRGALVQGETGTVLLKCRHVVIATGGIGQVYQTSTNPSVATGDGIAAAMRAGAAVRDMEFIQFHPTGLWSPNASGQAFLVSEAVRGEGGVLLNAAGERLMEGVHPLKDLAPRDIVARAIFWEMERTGTDHVYLDVTSRSADFLSNRFPTIYGECGRRGIAMERDLIPVCPVQHYLIGGVRTDLYGRTNVPGLFICGEAASTGIHGANRLASNSMLECLVFGRRAAETIRLALAAGQRDEPFDMPVFPSRPRFEPDDAELRRQIQAAMSAYGGVRRSGEGLETALNLVGGVYDTLRAGFADTRGYYELLNIVTVAEAILKAARARRESVGAHYREDAHGVI